MNPDCRSAIMDHVLGKAFTEGTLQTLMEDLWNCAYSLGYCEGQEGRVAAEREQEIRCDDARRAFAEWGGVQKP